MPKTTGSIRKVTLDGVCFTVAADADLSVVHGAYSNEAVATSGDNVRKITKRVESVESLDIIATGVELENLKGLSQRADDFPMSYVTAAGDLYRAIGFIDLEKVSTQDAKATIKMHPRSGGWELFAA